jgi:putative transposase
MKCKRFTGGQVIQILKEHELGAKTADVCRKNGISARPWQEGSHSGLTLSIANVYPVTG